MALRIYFYEPDDNVRLKSVLYRIVIGHAATVGSNYPWVLDGEDRLTLASPRWRDKASFRLRAYPGSGMVSFELVEPADTNIYLPRIDEKTYNHYHDEMMDLVYSIFQGRISLVERTPYVRRGPTLDTHHVQPRPGQYPPVF